MTRETDDFLHDLRAVAGELHPYTDPQKYCLTHTLMAACIVLRREGDAIRKRLDAVEAENAELRNQLAPPAPNRDQQLGIGKGPEQE